MIKNVPKGADVTFLPGDSSTVVVRTSSFARAFVDGAETESESLPDEAAEMADELSVSTGRDEVVQ